MVKWLHEGELTSINTESTDTHADHFDNIGGLTFSDIFL